MKELFISSKSPCLNSTPSSSEEISLLVTNRDTLCDMDSSICSMALSQNNCYRISEMLISLARTFLALYPRQFRKKYR